jgi:uncharacterized damage-inducible protein DinB
MSFMQRPSAGEYHENYQKYFDLVPEGAYLESLRQNSKETVRFFAALPKEKFDYRYAPGKWTIKELLMHLIDTERVFCYRALAAARGDTTPHFRMDEELYAKNVDVSPRTLESLLSEFQAVRTASERLFENITDAQSRSR